MGSEFKHHGRGEEQVTAEATAVPVEDPEEKIRLRDEALVHRRVLEAASRR